MHQKRRVNLAAFLQTDVSRYIIGGFTDAAFPVSHAEDLFQLVIKQFGIS